MTPLAANAECFTQTEWQAVNVQMLQRTLQVAALECTNVAGHSYDEQYNSFIARFHDRLMADGVAFRHHFRRVYGSSADTYQDRFVTQMANNASAKSMNSVNYCADPATAQMFKTALAVDAAQFEQAAVTAMSGNDLGQVCSSKAKVVLASSHKAKHHKKKPVKKVASAN